MTKTRTLLERAGTPALILIACLLLPRFMLENPQMAELAGEGEVGPTFWPTVMLWLTAICAAWWLAREVWTGLRAPEVRAEEATIEAPPQDPYNHLLAWFGVGLVFVYGFAIQYLGFAIATLLFIAAWSLLGGVRRPLVIAPVAVLGTIVLLYVFVALAQMPLDRGQGPLQAATVGIYDALGIY